MSNCGHGEETTLDFRTGRYVCTGCLRQADDKEATMRCPCGGKFVKSATMEVCYDCDRSRKTST